MTTLPEGVFRTRLLGGSTDYLKPLLYIVGTWCVIVFAPWNWPSQPWAVQAFQAFAETGEIRWGFVATTAIFAALSSVSFAQLFNRLTDPEKLEAVQDLRRFGDPIEIIRAFEQEAQTKRHLDSFLIIGTDNWLFLPGDAEENHPVLLPVERIDWAYEKSDTVQDVLNFALTTSGVMSERQRDLKKRDDDRVACFRLDGVPDAIKVKIPPSERLVEELSAFLRSRNPATVWGYDPKLDTLYNQNPAAFRAAARSFRSARPTLFGVAIPTDSFNREIITETDVAIFEQAFHAEAERIGDASRP